MNFLTFLCLLPLSGGPAGSFVMHPLQRSQRHVEVTVRAAPEGPQTLAVEILRILDVVKEGHLFILEKLFQFFRLILFL